MGRGRKRYTGTRRLASLRAKDYASILIDNHGDELRTAIRRRFDAELDMTDAQLEKLIYRCLMIYWKAIGNYAFHHGIEVFWCSLEKTLFWLKADDVNLLHSELMRGKLYKCFPKKKR